MYAGSCQLLAAAIVAPLLALSFAGAQPPRPPLPSSGLPEHVSHQGESDPPLVPPLVLRDEFEIYSVAFSPDSRLIASSNSMGWVLLWDAETGKLCWKRHLVEGNSVHDVAFSPDGTAIACGGRGEVVFLDVQTGKAIAQLKHDERALVLSVAFSPDGGRLASAAYASFIVWNLKTGKRELTLPCVGGNTGEKALVSDDGRTWKTVVVPDGSAQKVAFSPDGKILAAGSYLRANIRRKKDPAAVGDAVISLHDPKTGAELKRFDGADFDSIKSLKFSPSGRLLACGFHFGVFRLHDLVAGRVVEIDREFPNSVGRDVAFSPDGGLILLSGDGRKVPPRLFELGAMSNAQTLLRASEDIDHVAFSPDGRAVALTCADHSLIVQRLIPAAPRIAKSKSKRDVVERFWGELAHSDPKIRYQAIWALAGFPAEVLALASDALKNENSQPPLLAQQSFVRLLELINSPAAREVMDKLATGSRIEGVRKDAAAALSRVRHRDNLKPAKIIGDQTGPTR